MAGTFSQIVTSSWAQVGNTAGPMILQARGDVLFAFSASLPSASDPGFRLKMSPLNYSGLQSVYCRLRPAVAKGGVTGGGAVVFVLP